MFNKVLFLALSITLVSCQESKDKVIKLSLGHNVPSSSPSHLGAKRFAEIVAYKTGEKVQIKIHPNQELGTDFEMIKMVQESKLDFALPPTSKLTKIVPEAGFIDLPFIFNSPEEARRKTNDQVLEYLKSDFKSKGLGLLGFYEVGFKQFTSNKKINSLKDLQRLKLRVMNNPKLIQVYSKLGFDVKTKEFHKLASALETGEIEAQENPIVTIVNMNFHKHQKYLYLTNHSYLTSAFIMSSKLKKKLGDTFYKVVIDAVKESVRYQNSAAVNMENAFNEQLANSNIEVIKDTTSIVDKMKNKIQEEIMSLLESQPKVKDILDQRSDELLIGLDLCLEGKTKQSGISIQRGTELALSEINAAGGILGKQVRLEARNNSGFREKGIENIKYFNRQTNLIAIMGGMHSPVALAELKLIKKNKNIFLIPWAAATSIVRNGMSPNPVFRYSVRDQLAGPYLIKKAAELYNKKKICLLLENTPWGDGNKKSMSSALKKMGQAPLLVEKFNWGQEDFYKELSNMKIAKCSVVMFIGNAPEGKTFVDSMVKTNKLFPVISHWGITGGDFYKETKKNLKKVELSFLQTFSFSKSESKPKVRKFLNKYKEKYKLSKSVPILAPVGVIHAYELTKLLAKSIQLQGSIKYNEIISGMKKIKNHQGIFTDHASPFKNSNDALSAKHFSLCKYNTNGGIICE